MPINWFRLEAIREELDAELQLSKFRTSTYCARRRAKRGHGTSYTVDPTELEILQDASFDQSSPLWRPYPSRVVHPQQAFARLQTPVADTPETRVAAERIGAFLSRNTPIMWDLCIKIFCDYDTVLFHGDLRRRVCLRWRPYSGISGLVAAGMELNAIGLTQPRNINEDHIPRITTTLRADLDWNALPRLAALGVLVHEMLHAYFLVNCGYPGCFEMQSDDPSHGPIWTAAANYLERKTGLSLTDDWFEQATGRKYGL